MFSALRLGMILFLFAHVFSFLLDLFSVTRRSDRHKDLEILLLRQQLLIVHRKHPQPPPVSRWEKLVLAVLAAKLNSTSRTARDRLSQVSLLFKPDTLLKWHRELVRRKWTFIRRRPRGRPPTTPELRVLMLRLAKENPSWGYSKIHGELLKLGHDIGRSTVRDIIKRQQVPPAPERGMVAVGVPFSAITGSRCLPATTLR